MAGTRMLLMCLSGAMLAFGGVMIYNMNQKPPVAQVQSNAVNLQDVPRHPVTPEMANKASAAKGRVMAIITLPDSQGKTYSLPKDAGGKPMVIIGVKDGCPCNLESQPYFNLIQAHYAKETAWFGILDAGAKEADIFSQSVEVKYPILISPKDTKPFESLDIQQSVFTNVVNAKGEIIKQWPGYDQKMLAELDLLLSELTGKEPSQSDFSNAVKEPTSGCFFFQPVGWEPDKK